MRLLAEEAVELLELGATECRVQVRQAVVEADLVVDEGPFARQLCRRRQVLGAAAKLLVIGQDGAAAAGGDDLVAVEASSAARRACDPTAWPL